ncbi:hypothetical protein [Adhaeribacter pallidiroseus]|uniref:Uncharacterized protein n=1 Tax=Adhaeribacter pallidiroseus TaxID=2072847 RepID=A0A369QFG6_9BACT|nr:hypothetical protein [Adhaeribacter pallidiroseus]RDC63172.1 hypothetical protein AHMF7616_01773 [Adhaeribacter pallidiroseus]
MVEVQKSLFADYQICGDNKQAYPRYPKCNNEEFFKKDYAKAVLKLGKQQGSNELKKKSMY